MAGAKSQKMGFYYYCCGLALGIIIVMLTMATYSLVYPKTNRTKQPLITVNLFSPPKNIQIPILIYHYVEYVKDPNDTIRKSLNIIPPIFEKQVATLKEAGYTFLTPSNIARVLDGKEALPKKPVILSFDDGYADFYTDVFPILKKYNVRAVSYIVSGLVDTPNYLTSTQVKEIKKSNLVELACHSVNHSALGVATVEGAKFEIEQCKNQLRKKFNLNPVSFAYPYGSYNPFLYPILKKAGFKSATTTESGVQISNETIYNIPRLRPGIKVGSQLISFVENEVKIAKNAAPLVETVNAKQR